MKFAQPVSREEAEAERSNHGSTELQSPDSRATPVFDRDVEVTELQVAYCFKLTKILELFYAPPAPITAALVSGAIGGRDAVLSQLRSLQKFCSIFLSDDFDKDVVRFVCLLWWQFKIKPFLDVWNQCFYGKTLILSTVLVMPYFLAPSSIPRDAAFLACFFACAAIAFRYMTRWRRSTCRRLNIKMPNYMHDIETWLCFSNLIQVFALVWRRNCSSQHVESSDVVATVKPGKCTTVLISSIVWMNTALKSRIFVEQLKYFLFASFRSISALPSTEIPAKRPFDFEYV